MKYFFTAACFIGLIGCAGIAPLPKAPGVFPAVSVENATKFNTISCGVNPASRSQNTRVGPVNIASGFKGHVVKICENGALAQDVVFWSRANEDGTNIEAVITTLSGARLPQVADSANQPIGTNYFSFNTQSTQGTALNCTIIKPQFGISPAGLAICQS